LGFDNIISPLLDDWIQNTGIATSATRWLRPMTTEGSSLPAVAERLLKFSNWRLMIFGLALVIMMRLRPEGIIPSLRMQHELHPGDQRARAPA
jgi:branched-chain amino acid transport system permease protein